MPARRALIAGLGLIGGSIGLALRRAGWHVAYLDPNVDDAGDAADERVFDLGDADLTILATPVDVAMAMLTPAESRRHVNSGGGERGAGSQPASLITTVCSVMAPFRGENVVAGHPMAGSEQRGLAAARGDLFEGKTWFVERAHPLVDEVIAACGANREIVAPEEHDAAVALTSHLPQLLSTALAAYVADADLRFAGSGLRTFLRLANSDASVWKPIFAENRHNLNLDDVLTVMRKVLDGDEETFARAQGLLARLP